MKFDLKRQVIDREIVKIISKKCRKKDLDLFRPTQKNLLEIEKSIKEIQREGLPKRFVRKKLKGKLGFGIFLHPKAKPILKGEAIAPYAGMVSIVPQNRDDDTDYAFDPVTDLSLTKEEQKHFDPKNRYHPKRLYSLKLDAAKKGNFTRFINHSTKPNITAYFVSTPKHPYEIIYFAKKDILPGQQLLVNYEDGANTYWSALGIKPFPMTPKTFRLSLQKRLF